MTRDEFENEIELILDSETGSDNTFHVDALLACYDAQQKENAQLKQRLRKLERLEAAGVDNWEGYELAMEDVDA